MASLRARLLAGLLALTAAGMLIAGWVTYAEQRSFAYERIDDQTRGGRVVQFAALRYPAGGPWVGPGVATTTG